MRNVVILICLTVVAFSIAGCQPKSESSKELLVVSFDPVETKEETLRYSLISERNTTIDLGASGKKSSKPRTQTITEKLELIIAYKPIALNPYGLTTVEGVCESAKVKRTSTRKASKEDAVESLAGKSFRFKISPSGNVEDYSQINELLTQVAKKAFSEGGSKKRNIKNPDMILDFIAMQWYLWASVASLQNPHEGVAIGNTWQALELIPFPAPAIFAKQTTYTFDSVTDSPNGRIAKISSSFAYSDRPLENIPMPYSQDFQLRGLFGFLSKYKIQSIDGLGADIINIDTGVLQSRNQQYKLEVTAAFLMPLGGMSPKLSIDQKINIQLLEDKP